MTPLPAPPECPRCGASVIGGRRGDVCSACQATQQLLTAKCSCGSPILDDAQVLDAVEEAAKALRSRTTFVPDAVWVLLREVSGAMACRLGRCGRAG